MTHRLPILVAAAVVAASSVQTAAAPPGVSLSYAEFATQAQGLKLEAVQAVHSQAQDLVMDGPSRRRVISGQLIPRRLPAAAGDEHIGLRLDRFSLSIWQAENELAPVGADALEGLELIVPTDAHGPSGPVGFGAQEDRDATTWASSEPLAEVLGQVVGLGLPRLPADPVVPGDAWSCVRKAPAALIGLPGVGMEVYHFYLYLGQADCGPQTCARIAEVFHVSSLERRLFGSATIGVDLEGVGRAVHLVRLGPGGPVRVEGRMDLEARVSSHTAPGLPPNYITHTNISTVYSLAPLED